MKPKERVGPKLTDIIFTGRMPRMIIDGLKKETRRIAKPQPPSPADIFNQCGEGYSWKYVDVPMWNLNHWEVDGDKKVVKLVEDLMGCKPIMRCRYGVAGDHLYVKEDHYIPPSLRNNEIKYRSDLDIMEQIELKKRGWKYRAARYLKRDYSRLLLEIAYVHLERLQEITESGALLEGITENLKDEEGALYWCGSGAYTDERNPAFDKSRAVLGYRGGFGVKWNEMHGTTWPWLKNPWVWVVGFKKLEYHEHVSARVI